MQHRILLYTFVLLSLIASPDFLFAWNKLTDTFDINCKQSSATLDCEYRFFDANKPKSITAKAGDVSLPIKNIIHYPDSKNTIALLFVVDTSDPGRQNVIEKNKSQIKTLISLAKPNYKIGLASFDKSLRIESPIGTSSFLLFKALDNLKAIGKTTELYRDLIVAIDHLKTIDAQRKAIILLSDGQAEDKAYFHSDVIKAARASGVIINSIGYPRTVALSVALQTLRRLSEETGGSYIETDLNYNIPDSYLKNPFDNIDNGGKFSVELGEYFKNNPSDVIKINFETNSGNKSINVPVKVENQKISQIPVQPAQTSPASTKKTNTNTAVPVQIITRQVETQPINLWLWYGIPAAFIIIIVLILITLFLLWQRQPASKNKASDTDYRPYAYLIADDENDTRFPITRTIWRIGRGKDNELALDDTSVSRRHAEIHRNSNGTFDIIDMNSMNGVYINNEKVGKAMLHEGDVIEIGDIFLRFTQLSADYSLDESTVMQKTKTPSTH